MAIIFCRTIVIFLVLLIFMRLLGKRQLGELELSELVVSILLADAATLPLQDIGIPLINSLVPVTTLFALEMLLSALSLRYIRLRTLVWGKPCFLIEKGVINQREMSRCRLSLDELMVELRRKSVLDLAIVEYAVLETDGTLNVLLIPSARTVTAGQMKLAEPSAGYPLVVIMQGRLLEDNLRRCGRDEDWLREELHRQGVQRREEVYLMTVNAAGQVYCAAKEEV